MSIPVRLSKSNSILEYIGEFSPPIKFPLPGEDCYVVWCKLCGEKELSFGGIHGNYVRLSHHLFTLGKFHHYKDGRKDYFESTGAWKHMNEVHPFDFDVLRAKLYG